VAAVGVSVGEVVVSDQPVAVPAVSSTTAAGILPPKEIPEVK
jgi:hypothetical protein